MCEELASSAALAQWHMALIMPSPLPGNGMACCCAARCRSETAYMGTNRLKTVYTHPGVANMVLVELVDFAADVMYSWQEAFQRNFR